jgi:hypothetical protein
MIPGEAFRGTPSVCVLGTGAAAFSSCAAAVAARGQIQPLQTRFAEDSSCKKKELVNLGFWAGN